jgi:hypothetical protein
MAHPDPLTPMERWEAETTGPERVLQASLQDPTMGRKDKARVRAALLKTTLARGLRTLNI